MACCMAPQRIAQAGVARKPDSSTSPPRACTRTFISTRSFARTAVSLRLRSCFPPTARFTARPSRAGPALARSTASNGYGPFISLVNVKSGAEGARVGILGQGFSSKSVVEFGGTKATTTKLTGTTYILATVPTGALTGDVTVTTGPTKLSTTASYKITPTYKSFKPPSGPVGTVVSARDACHGRGKPRPCPLIRGLIEFRMGPALRHRLEACVDGLYSGRALATGHLATA
jgi:hypothetical protein